MAGAAIRSQIPYICINDIYSMNDGIPKQDPNHIRVYNAGEVDRNVQVF